MDDPKTNAEPEKDAWPVSENHAVTSLRAAIDRFLQEKIGAADVDDDGSFFLRYEDTVAFIDPMPFGDDHAIARVYAFAARSVVATPELMRYLLATNALVAVGKFGLVNGDTDVIFEHVLYGEGLTAEALATTVYLVLGTAARHGAQIRERFGGKTFFEVEA